MEVLAVPDLAPIARTQQIAAQRQSGLSATYVVPDAIRAKKFRRWSELLALHTSSCVCCLLGRAELQLGVAVLYGMT